MGQREHLRERSAMGFENVSAGKYTGDIEDETD
jgi:hypothetical protein